MHPDVILSRTGLAQTEIRTRTHGLTPRLRRLLLLVDGRTSVAGTVERYGGLIGPDIEALLDDLHAQGYLAPGATRTTDSAVPAAGPLALGAARQRALALLAATVGPVSGRMGAGAARHMERLSAAGSVAQWQAALAELDAALPRLVAKGDLDRVRTQLAALAPATVEAVAPAPSAGIADDRLDALRVQALAVLAGAVGPIGGRMNAAAARRVERIEAATTAGELRAALTELDTVLERLVPKREVERVRTDLAALSAALVPDPAG